MGEKPHMGSIQHWHKYECGTKGLGYLIRGQFIDHPYFAGEYGQTSYVVAHDEATGEIETRNSRYKLVGKPTEVALSKGEREK